MRSSNVRAKLFIRPAFTLVEITLCVLILGIIAAVATPKYFSSLDRFRLESAVKTLTSDVLLTQRSARQTNSIRILVFNLAESTYSAENIASVERASGSHRVILTDPPYQCKLTGLIDSGQPSQNLSTLSLSFNRFGIPDRGATITLQSGGLSKSISVDASTGIARQP